ncbi:hypothetical protein [Enterococcus canis]|nr:hypothetical protein [Enterococcus canis]
MKKWREAYQNSKQPNEDFLYWLLVRKLSTTGKVILAAILWGLWMKYAFNLVFMLNFFKFIIVVAIIYFLYSLIHFLMKNWQR